MAVKCDSCVRAHKKQALKAGAGEKEILEAAAVAGLVRMGSGFNTAYALLDDQEPGRKIHFKAGIEDEKKQNNRPEEDKTILRKPDGYLNSIYGKKDQE